MNSHLRHILFDADAQRIDTVAARMAHIGIFIVTAGRDGLAAPCYTGSRCDRRCVMIMEGNTPAQDSSDDTVATIENALQRVGQYLRRGVRCAFPFYTAAEGDGLRTALYRLNGQNQLIDTVIAGYGLLTIKIMNRLTDTLLVQVRLAMPAERLVFADGLRLDEMIRRLVFGQDQTPYIVASCLGILRYMLIDTGLRHRVGLCHTVIRVLPVIRVHRVQYSCLLIDLRRVLGNDDFIGRVGRVGVVVGAGIGVGLTVEGHTLSVAQTETAR